MTQTHVQTTGGTPTAAMEPAEDRLDDVGTRIDAGHGASWPQWSQPRIGWMTAPGSPPVHTAHTPQWSQPRIGWMTQPLAGLLRRGVGAAMEPAEDRLDDPTGTCTRRKGTPSRNGASRGSAG